MSRSRLVRLMAAVVFVTAATLAVLRPPICAVRSLAVAASPWLVTGASPEDGRVVANAKRLVGAWVQLNLAGAIAERIGRGASSEEETLHRAMLLVRDKVISGHEFSHYPHSGPVLIAGLGYCDQVNGAVALIAARHFKTAQIYALYDAKQKRSPHTVGRVWSDKRRDWIYFDAFFDVPVMYTIGHDGKPSYIAQPPVRPLPKRSTPDRTLYALPGWVLADYPTDIVTYVLARSSRIAQTQIAPEVKKVGETGTPPIAARWTARPVIPKPVTIDESTFARVSRDFVQTRFDDLLGEAAAIGEYRHIAADAGASNDEKAVHVSAVARLLAEAEAEAEGGAGPAPDAGGAPAEP